jgi:hypothetical protein
MQDCNDIIAAQSDGGIGESGCGGSGRLETECCLTHLPKINTIGLSFADNVCSRAEAVTNYGCGNRCLKTKKSFLTFLK